MIITIVKYAASMKAGHADPESILRRFNQNNLKHPTYMALSQLDLSTRLRLLHLHYREAA